ncbi:MAG: galactose oxidase [Firmicutes bacterium]|nr:galactose oxidase [Bacillota bacterium]
MKRLTVIIMLLVIMLGMTSFNTWADEAEWQIEATNASLKRDGSATVAIGNDIYVIGGRSTKVDIYNIQTKEWRVGKSIPNSIHASAVSVYEDKIYVFNGVGADKLVQIYNTESDSWSNGANMSVAKYGAMAVTVDKKIYVMGGRFLNGLDIYDIETDTWSAGTSMPIAVDRGAAVAFGKYIYVFGGLVDLSTNGSTNAVQIYDTETGNWTSGTSMPSKRSLSAAVAVGEDIYVIGGITASNGTVLTTVEIFNTTTNTWSTGPSLNSARYNLGAAFINGKIFIAGTLDTIESLQLKTSSNLKAVSGNSKADLTWNTVTAATSYTIKRSPTTGGPYTTIATGITGTSYSDTDVDNGSTYYYIVTAIVNGSEGWNSNEASATPQASTDQPTGNKALLVISMVTSERKEYEMTADEINDFIAWYNSKAASSPTYVIEKDYNKASFTARKDYIAYEQISNFEVNEYKE